MRTAPKDRLLLVRERSYNTGKFVTIPAMWGQPAGFKEPGWWGTSFSHVTPSSNAFSDLPELRCVLLAITPDGWKPWARKNAMAETQAVRFFFRQVADHVSGVKAMEPEHASAAAELLRQIADSKPALDGGWQVPKPPVQRRVTFQMVVNRCIEMEQHSRQQAAEVKKSRKKWEREMVDSYNADADEYKKLGELIKARDYKAAFKYWQNLDTFVREGIPSTLMRWVLGKVK